MIEHGYYNPQGMAYRLDYKGVKSEITHFPGIMCSVGVSNSVVVPSELRGKGLGGEAHKHRLQFAKAQGFRYLMCTIKTDNQAQKRILEKNGWERVYKTMKTYCDYIDLYIKDLVQDNSIDDTHVNSLVK